MWTPARTRPPPSARPAEVADPAERRVSHEAFAYYDVYVPAGGDGPRPLLVATHGYGGDKASMLRAARRVFLSPTLG